MMKPGAEITVRMVRAGSEGGTCRVERGTMVVAMQHLIATTLMLNGRTGIGIGRVQSEQTGRQAGAGRLRLLLLIVAG
jgi:hypothetical protein